MAGILGITPAEAYELHEPGEYHDGTPIPKITPWTPGSVQATLEQLTDKLGQGARRKHLVEHFVDTVPIWPFDGYFHKGLSFGLTGPSMCRSWLEHLRAMTYGGYYGMTNVATGGNPAAEDLDPMDPHRCTNHWVTLCGHRVVHRPHATMPHAASLDEEVLVSDSCLKCPETQWVNFIDFLRTWGGFHIIWIKPV